MNVKEKIKIMRNNKGITLIALVLTIIVLLILTAVTISLTIGKNGIVNRAKEARIETEKAQLKEELELAILNIQKAKILQGEKMTREYLKELENIGVIIESTGIPTQGEYKGYYIEIDENYKVTIVDKIKGARPKIQAVVITTGAVEQGKTVQIKVTASISEGNIQTIEATNGAVLKTDVSQTEKIFEVSENGIYSFTAKADNGMSVNTNVEINTIIEKPIIEIKDITKTGFTIVVTNDYNEELITEYKYYVGGVLKSEGTTEKEFTVTGLEAETEYTNIYVEVCIGEVKLKNEATSTTTKPLGLEYSWEELEKVAEAISNNDETITRDDANVNIKVNGKTYELAVGDTAKVSVNGTLKTVRILGFNHDTLSDTSAYGEGKTNTYAGISFEFVNFIKSSSINSATCSGGWAACTLRSTLNSDTELNKLENISKIKMVNKTYLIKNGTTTTQTSQDKIWLLSCSEIWNNGPSDSMYGIAKAKEGEQYKYYKDINANYSENNPKLIKSSSKWWLRSPHSSQSRFCFMSNEGKCLANLANTNSLGVAPGFAI